MERLTIGSQIAVDAAQIPCLDVGGRYLAGNVVGVKRMSIENWYYEEQMEERVSEAVGVHGRL